jgi:hypothetical protein
MNLITVIILGEERTPHCVLFPILLLKHPYRAIRFSLRARDKFQSDTSNGWMDPISIMCVYIVLLWKERMNKCLILSY